MIPKIIHYCWLSNDAFPKTIEKCIATWKDKLPDYEFILWDTNRFNLEENIWVKQAFENKKYAFAADYIRLYAVYNFGGIYLDTDIEVVKSFDDLLELPYFIGSEGNQIIEAGVFGAEKNCDWVGKCLDYYQGKSFLNQDATFNTLTLPRIMMSQIQQLKTIVELPKHEIFERHLKGLDAKTLALFPPDYFCAKNQGTGIINTTQNTYSIHHFAMSWVPKRVTFLPNIKRKLISFFGLKTINRLIHFFNLKSIKAKLSK